MTHYVLHGGQTSKKSSYNNFFFKQFTELVKKDYVNILMCYFSRNREEWGTLFRRDSEKIIAQSSKKINYTIPENPKDLFQKLHSHDVLYIAGGKAELIEALLPQLTKLKTSLNNKVYIGSSMGAFIVSKYYMVSRKVSTAVREGLGILPIKTLCHWDAEHYKEQKVTLLKKKEPELPILFLEECKFVQFMI